MYRSVLANSFGGWGFLQILWGAGILGWGGD